jgi:hypothetical protein
MTVSEVVPSPRLWRNGEPSSNRLPHRQGTIRSSATIAGGAFATQFELEVTCIDRTDLELLPAVPDHLVEHAGRS